jgi:hypothetical protein
MATPAGGSGEFLPRTLHTESFGEVGLSFAAICGAMGGSIGGSALGAEFSTAIPLLWGTLGTMLGSVLAAGGWWFLASTWTALGARKASHHNHQTAGEPAHASFPREPVPVNS